ncbi:thermonuclease family protein [Sphingomonas sp. ac-8]|uniref:thermonuclease family protein n=1 Tax=Sphingomonas sp. ac-8 TaxID=3242977 RepID=UPI003A807061
MRLWGINAPQAGEICDRNGEPYPCGKEAADFLGRTLAGKTVTCHLREAPKAYPAVAICSFRQRIRPAEEPSFETTQNVQMAMVHWGYAKDNAQESDGAFAKLEAQARANRWGLWNGVFTSAKETRYHGDGGRGAGCGARGLPMRIYGIAVRR